MELDILCFGAHPDDIELACGGTIIKAIQNGNKVGVIDLTRGELGTRGNINTRDKETKIATDIMGVIMRENMNFKDGFFQNDEIHKIKLINKIREYKPKIVIANAISDRHPDHGRAAQMIVDACFLSGLDKVDTGQSSWRPNHIYHYIQFNNINPDFVVDITNQIEDKIRAVKAYKTQFYNPSSDEKSTIISSPEFLDSITYRAQDLGRQSGCKFAEGFITNQLIKVDSLFDIK